MESFTVRAIFEVVERRKQGSLHGFAIWLELPEILVAELLYYNMEDMITDLYEMREDTDICLHIKGLRLIKSPFA